MELVTRPEDTQELVYVDPQTKQEFVLNHDKTDWVPKGTAPAQASENKDYEFDGKTYLHTDSSGVKHKWDLDEKKWVVVKEDSSKAGKKGGNGQEEEEEEESEEDDETTDADRKARQFRKRKAAPGWGTQGEYLKDPDTGVQLYRDAKDGMLYEWDSAKNAWFPRIDEDFMAQYQVWSLTEFYSVDFSVFSQSKNGLDKCVFNKRTIKVCVSCC